MARTVDELLVYQKALRAAAHIAMLMRTPEIRSDSAIYRQIDRGSVRVASDIAEGFEQKTDRGFARYLFDARGSARELCTQLTIAGERHAQCAIACRRGYTLYDEIARMLTGLIRHLQREDRKDRFRR